MTDVLVPNLNFSPNRSVLPRAGQLLLVTDHLAAPAEFVLHRALHLCLKSPHDTAMLQQRVVLVSLSRDLSHWRAIASKSGVNLTHHLKTGSLAFVDGLSISTYTKQDEVVDDVGCTRCPPLFLVDGVKSEPSLKGLYDVIQRTLPPVEIEANASTPMVIIDDITILSFIGISDIAITRFIRALRVLCRRHSAGLIIRAHTSPTPQNMESIPFASDVLRALIESSHRHVEVRPLASGRSGAISGEVAVHFGGPGSADDAGDKMGRGTAVHYRLSDSGATFFQKGMSAGVL